jgi:mediator of DNA damage checkpoint protein 1
VISCKEDIAIWRPIAAQGIPIYSQELLLTGVLKQELEWDGGDVRVDI